MNKQLLAASAVVIASSTALAFDGFYVGGAVSYDRATAELAGLSSNSKVKPKGFGGDIFLGSNFFNSNNFVIGVESFVGASSTKKTEGTTKVESKSHFDVALRAGYLVDTTLLYVKVGASARKFNAEYTTGSRSFTALDPVYGVGAEYKVDNIGVRLEYNYAKYKKQPLLTNLKDSVKYNRVLLGAAWYF